MSAANARLLEALESTEEALYSWGDECRSTSERLGLPATSGIARMIEQQRVFERGLRGTHRKVGRPKLVELNGAMVRVCPQCRLIVVGNECDRCARRTVEEVTARGTQTRSLKPPPMSQLSSVVVEIEVIVTRAPGWMQQCLMLSYLWRVRDHKAAQRLRIRTSTYQEKKLASVEYVAERLAR